MTSPQWHQKLSNSTVQTFAANNYIYVHGDNQEAYGCQILRPEFTVYGFMVYACLTSFPNFGKITINNMNLLKEQARSC